MIACRTTVPETWAVFAIVGYSGGTLLTRDAASTLPPTRIRSGVDGLGGGGTDDPSPMIPPSTFPVPPATPSSPFALTTGASSFTGTTVFGITVGATIWGTLITFKSLTCFTTACGGGGGGGGAGAT